MADTADNALAEWPHSQYCTCKSCPSWVGLTNKERAYWQAAASTAAALTCPEDGAEPIAPLSAGLDLIIGDAARHLDDAQVFAVADAVRAAGYVQAATIDVVFDGPPGHDGGRFVEVEDAGGRSVNVGDWIDRGDGFWALRVSASRPAFTDETRLLTDALDLTRFGDDGGDT